jgi:uncharacterized protein YdiU (UPF0061 family)
MFPMIKFNNTYNKLPSNFFEPTQPEIFNSPKLLAFNSELANQELGLSIANLTDVELSKLFSGQELPEGSEPIALAYAGHQFGHFVPQLGDGRAVLLGEVLTPENKRFDIQLKGSGRTYFSRGGDGKSSLGPVIREYIVSEAMHFLRVPTTRALAAVLTGEEVFREAPLPGAILTRVASSHIRVGTFEFLAAQSDLDGLKTLVNYCVERHYPNIKNDENIYLSFIKEVSKKQSRMVAKWMSLGFIHGVMNTDNMSISGETIDFGPCAFMDNFSNQRVFSSIDRNARYAYSNQMEIAKWNLTRLASCLIPLLSDDEDKAIEKIQKTINICFEFYQKDWLEQMSRKFGIELPQESDEKIINTFLTYLQQNDLDFTQSFRNLSDDSFSFNNTESFKEFKFLWNNRLTDSSTTFEQAKEIMEKVNPIFIPRNHQVERAIQGALKGDLTVFNQMIEVSKNPFQEQAEFTEFKVPPKENERIAATFCGT